jgi:hypothetical protein
VRFFPALLLCGAGLTATALLACATTGSSDAPTDISGSTSTSVSSTPTPAPAPAPAPRPSHPNASPNPETDPPVGQDATFVGEAICAACHPSEHMTWSASGHATARSSLEESRRSYSPECLSCHTTGLYRESGFSPTSPDPSLENVGCESCHGAGSSHIGDPTAQKYGGLPSSSEACVSCHNNDRSPDFEWEPYWLEIAH